MNKEIKQGDILLVKYKLDPIGALIRFFCKSDYNHAGIFIDKETVFEVRGKRNRITKLSEYDKFYYKTKILRLKGIAKKGIQRTIAELKKLDNVKRKRIDIWKGFYNVIRDRKPETNTCSGTIALFLELYANFKFDLTISPELITPKHIEKSEETEVLI